LEGQDDRYDWPTLDEQEASSLCYTSGTTGNPKGVLYSHRSTMLHLFAMVMFDGLNITGLDTVLPAVPMFHVNAWGIPYAACMLGTKLVLPGPALDGASIYGLAESEGVTVSAGVPSVWQGVLSHIDARGLRFSTLKRLIIGGSACSPALMHRLQDDLGVAVQHAWGMTELSPLGVSCTFKPKHAALTSEERYAVQVKQGHAVFGVDIRVVDDNNIELPWDGRSAGEIQVRGPWVASDYFQSEVPSPLVDGWFCTGDIGTIDSDGYMQLTDRSKDAIKSGGEWISSIDLENIAMAHPGVAMAACIAMPHPKWDERPLLLIQRKNGATVSRQELLARYEGKVAKWWLPDEILFVEQIPLGATGKILKSKLREDLREGAIVLGAENADNAS
jgi:acyl-CoA synthetase (AMP-forming)/AMP-acid ligase II